MGEGKPGEGGMGQVEGESWAGYHGQKNLEITSEKEPSFSSYSN